jgi:hypothetical protein
MLQGADAANSKACASDTPVQLVAFWNFAKREAELTMDGKTYSTKSVAPAKPGDEGFRVKQQETFDVSAVWVQSRFRGGFAAACFLI